MKITVFEDYKKMSQAAAKLLYSEIKKKPSALVCIATGSTPTLAYDLLTQKYQKDKTAFNKLRIIKLDEWGGIPSDDPATCETYIQEHIIKPLNISDKRYTSFHSNPKDKEREVKRISNKLAQEGPIDICVLGLGVNGHLGFNEPADWLHANVHIAHLTATTKHHSMAKKAKHTIKYGLTLGLSNIMNAKKIILLVNGKSKEKIVEKLMEGKITAHLPGSMLWIHPDVTLYCDKEAV